ncbi:MAG: peptide chain release factor N(5)-glutamine methyltransferase [bacterium]
MKTLIEVLQSGTAYLAGRGVESARLVMEQLMSHILDCPRLQLYIRFESVVPESHLVSLRDGIKRLGSGEPLQYVVGDTEFMGHRFKTDARALIPRPDTESLVIRVLECAPLWVMDNPVIADIGTGSGCVAISLALVKSEARYRAVDAREAALELARENAAMNGVAPLMEFRCGNLLEGFEPESLHAVVANLPYIPTVECQQLPRHIRDYEPLSALDGGADGLDFIRQLAVQAFRVLRPGGWLFLEIGFDQGALVVEWLENHQFTDIRIHKDLGNRDRVVVASR